MINSDDVPGWDEYLLTFVALSCSAFFPFFFIFLSLFNLALPPRPISSFPTNQEIIDKMGGGNVRYIHTMFTANFTIRDDHHLSEHLLTVSSHQIGSQGCAKARA